MKKLFTILCSLLSLSGFASKSSYEKLCEVNKCWREQTDVDRNQMALAAPMDETAWIRLHLSRVEQTLRSRSTAHLTAKQAQNRQHTLDDLNRYWQAGQFPQNEDYSYRTPIFIDKHDNFCAVGYLVKASGHEAVSRMIAANTNLAYVKDMKYPELARWAADYGFSIDELAWIQPGYPPINHTQPLGKGVDGVVKELFADNDQNILYVGGSFLKADSTLLVNNIAYVTEQAGVYTWHKMGTGVNGTVQAIVKFDNKIFVAGTFTEAGGVAANNIAYWDGSAWHSAGCTYGTINSLAVYNGALYAAGSFDVCAALSNINFARWNGTSWQQLPGLNGPVNTMFVSGGDLVLGGAFSYNNQAANVIKWNSTSSFTAYANKISNEVKDLEVFGDTLYAVCKRTHATDTLSLIVKLKGNAWEAIDPNPVPNFIPGAAAILSLNTLCVAGNSLMLGGSFRFIPVVGYFGNNCMDISPTRMAGAGSWFDVDSVLNKMVVFKGAVIAGGGFKYGNGASMASPRVTLNGIARQVTAPTGVPILPSPKSISLYPNPAHKAGIINIAGDFNASRFAVTDLTGRNLLSGRMDAQSVHQVSLPSTMATGIYLIELANDKGEKMTKKFVVE
jgi:hypothetical protein